MNSIFPGWYKRSWLLFLVIFLGITAYYGYQRVKQNSPYVLYKINDKYALQVDTIAKNASRYSIVNYSSGILPLRLVCPPSARTELSPAEFYKFPWAYNQVRTGKMLFNVKTGESYQADDDKVEKIIQENGLSIENSKLAITTATSKSLPKIGMCGDGHCDIMYILFLLIATVWLVVGLFVATYRFYMRSRLSGKLR